MYLQRLVAEDHDSVYRVADDADHVNGLDPYRVLVFKRELSEQSIRICVVTCAKYSVRTLGVTDTV